jgi:peptidoglycan/LPS O-acetylase OafA/YrhL
MQYRREIDGLRAFAVVPVVLAHAGFSWMGGGFVGVDVFFVISGYLITGIILSELDAGNFTFAGFYERRARRILPALFCVLTCSIFFALLFMMPDQLGAFSKSLLSVLAFVSNFYFKLLTGYFAPAAEEMPLLHTWSLGVEEQFYLFFPLLAIILWRSRRKTWVFPVVILIIALLSFNYADHKSWGGSAKVFFTTQARVWELFFGVLAAFYLNYRRKHEPQRWLAEAGSLFGLACIVLACLYFNPEMPFPGRYALLPTVGAVCVILFASPSTFVGRLLSLKPLVGIGLVSYSAYLWHQPVFAFARLAAEFSESSWLTPWVLVLLAVLSFMLAYSSWRFVEQPFRNRKRLTRQAVFACSGVGVLVFVIIAGGGVLTHGLLQRFNPDDLELLIPLEQRTQYVNQRHRELAVKGSFSSDNKLRVLILGDSFSEDLVNMIAEASLLPNADIRVRYIPAKCQIYRGKEDVSRFVIDTARPACEKDFYDGLPALQASADVVILAAYWVQWSAERLPDTLHNFSFPPSARIVVIGRKHFGKVRRKAYLGMSHEQRSSMRGTVSDAHLETNALMKTNLQTAGVEFIDLHALVCGEASPTCPVFTPEGLLISYDSDHLTQAGAAYIGSLLAGHSVFNKRN